MWNEFPKMYKCPKCHHTMNYSSYDDYKESPLTQNNNPICPKCWNDFILGIGAEMRCIVDFGVGSDYDNTHGDKKLNNEI